MKEILACQTWRFDLPVAMKWKKNIKYQKIFFFLEAFNQPFSYLRYPDSERVNLYLTARGLFAKAMVEGVAIIKDTDRSWYNSTIERMANGFKVLEKMGLVKMEISDNEAELKNNTPFWKDYSITFTLKLIKNK